MGNQPLEVWGFEFLAVMAFVEDKREAAPDDQITEFRPPIRGKLRNDLKWAEFIVATPKAPDVLSDVFFSPYSRAGISSISHVTCLFLQQVPTLWYFEGMQRHGTSNGFRPVPCLFFV